MTVTERAAPPPAAEIKGDNPSRETFANLLVSIGNVQCTPLSRRSGARGAHAYVIMDIGVMGHIGKEPIESFGLETALAGEVVPAIDGDGRFELTLRLKLVPPPTPTEPPAQSS